MCKKMRRDRQDRGARAPIEVRTGRVSTSPVGHLPLNCGDGLEKQPGARAVARVGPSLLASWLAAATTAIGSPLAPTHCLQSLHAHARACRLNSSFPRFSPICAQEREELKEALEASERERATMKPSFDGKGVGELEPLCLMGSMWAMCWLLDRRLRVWTAWRTYPTAISCRSNVFVLEALVCGVAGGGIVESGWQAVGLFVAAQCCSARRWVAREAFDAEQLCSVFLEHEDSQVESARVCICVCPTWGMGMGQSPDVRSHQSSCLAIEVHVHLLTCGPRRRAASGANRMSRRGGVVKSMARLARNTGLSVPLETQA